MGCPLPAPFLSRPRLAPIEPWQRAQYLVVLTVALTHVSFDLTQPFVPLYIRTLGVTDLSEASIWSGLIEFEDRAVVGVAGDEELIASRNGEKHSERNAGEQDRKLLPRAVSEQH